VPKAHTPFQWCQQISLEQSREKIRALRSKLKGKGLDFRWQNPQMSLLEGLWARGDRRLSRLLVAAYDAGCRLDGWSDQFQYGRWLAAIEACGVDVDSYTTRERDLSEPLPWDHVDCGVSKEFQEQEWEKALEESETPDCRGGDCNQCGVCDLETVRPLTFQAETAFKARDDRDRLPEKGPYKMLQVSYAKRGQAKYFGHLELVKIFIRAFRRSRIPLRFSEGFHPAPKISFEAALPVGTESLEEHLVVEVTLNVAPRTVIDRLNQELPEGLRITACRTAHRRLSGPDARVVRYTVALKQGFFSETKLRDFLESKVWPLTKTNRKGRRKTIDLKPLVKELRLLGPQKADMSLDVQTGRNVRPSDVLTHVFGLSEEDMKLAAIVKHAG